MSSDDLVDIGRALRSAAETFAGLPVSGELPETTLVELPWEDPLEGAFDVTVRARSGDTRSGTPDHRYITATIVDRATGQANGLLLGGLPSGTAADVGAALAASSMPDRLLEHLRARCGYGPPRAVTVLEVADGTAPAPWRVDFDTAVVRAVGRFREPSRDRSVEWTFEHSALHVARSRFVLVARDHESRSIELGEASPRLTGWAEDHDTIGDFATVLEPAEAAALLINPRLDRDLLDQTRTWLTGPSGHRTENHGRLGVRWSGGGW